MKDQAQGKYISVENQLFSLSEEELSKAIQGGQIPLSAWIYEENAKDWQPLCAFEAYRDLHPELKRKPKSKPSALKARSSEELASLGSVNEKSLNLGSGAVSLSQEPIWFVVRDRKKYGPYSAPEIIRQLQHKELDSKSYAWKPGFETWKPLLSIDEFSRDTMKKILNSSSSVDILVKRKFTRAPYEVEVIAHDNNHAIEGKTMVIGEGGLFLSTSKVSHSVGTRLKLHFMEQKNEKGGTPAFNAVAEVVSIVRGQAPGYCMRFVAISDSDRKKIAKYVSEKK